MPISTERRTHFLIGLFLVSLLINLITLSITTQSPPHGDQLSYEALGCGIATGTTSASHYQAPAYQYFIASIYLVFGCQPIYVAIVQSILAAISVLLVYWLALRCFCVKTAVISSLLAAFSTDLILYSGLLLSESLFISTLLAALISFSYIPFDGSGSMVKTSARTGVFLGFGALIKTPLALFGPLLMLWRVIVERSFRVSVVKGFLILGAAMFLTIVPWTLRNHFTYGELIFLTTNGGEVFWQGNNSGATGGDISHLPEFSNHAIVKMDPIISNKIGYNLGFQWIKEHPLEFGILFMKKIGMFWSLIRDYQYDDLWGPYIGNAMANFLPSLYNFVLVPLAVLGFLATFRPRANWFFLHLVVMLFTFVHAMYISGVRYRVGIVPVLVIFSAQGAILLLQLYRNKWKDLGYREKRALFCGVGLIAMIFVFSASELWSKFTGLR